MAATLERRRQLLIGAQRLVVAPRQLSPALGPLWQPLQLDRQDGRVDLVEPLGADRAAPGFQSFFDHGLAAIAHELAQEVDLDRRQALGGQRRVGGMGQVGRGVDEGAVRFVTARLEMAGGAVAMLDVNVASSYGYRVVAEIVGSEATARSTEGSAVEMWTSGAMVSAVSANGPDHFSAAYLTEVSAWVQAACGGGVTGPSAWDGYMANLVASALVEAEASGGHQVETPEVVIPEAGDDTDDQSNGQSSELRTTTDVNTDGDDGDLLEAAPVEVFTDATDTDGANIGLYAGILLILAGGGSLAAIAATRRNRD